MNAEKLQITDKMAEI